MKKLTLSITTAAALCATALAAPAHAGHDSSWDYARVVRAEPIVRSVRVRQPHEECREEPVTERRVVHGGPHDPGGILLGGIIGGVIGHQFGHGAGRDRAAAVGAAIGASHAAHHQAWHNRRVVERTVYETTCRTTYESRWEERVEGYDVTYRYQGRLYHTRTVHDPGERIRVRVDVTPVAYEDDLD